MATKDKQYLTTINTALSKSLTVHKDALPVGFNSQRFAQNCMAMLQDGQADYSNCDPNSLVRTLMKAGYLGLDFFNGECYAIPYGTQCTFQTDYKGELKLAKKYSTNPIQDIYAKVVRDGDDFSERIENGKQYVNFTPKPFNTGDIIGAFAVVLYKDGSMLYDTMSKEEIEHTRNTFSKAANSKAWKESYGEMCKKTVLRRLLKLVDLNFDTPEQIQAFEEGSLMDVKGNQKERYTAKNIYADRKQKDDAIDISFQEVEEADYVQGE